MLGSVISVVLAWAAWRVLSDALPDGPIGQILSVGSAIGAAALAYLAAAMAMDMPELRTLTRLRRPLQ